MEQMILNDSEQKKWQWLFLVGTERYQKRPSKILLFLFSFFSWQLIQANFPHPLIIPLKFSLKV